jgi:hypothetical protein
MLFPRVQLRDPLKEPFNCLRRTFQKVMSFYDSIPTKLNLYIYV